MQEKILLQGITGAGRGSDAAPVNQVITMCMSGNVILARKNDVCLNSDHELRLRGDEFSFLHFPRMELE